MKKLWAWLLTKLQDRCEHPPGTVSADVMEGSDQEYVYTAGGNVGLITNQDKELMAEIRADAKAFQILQDKCRWEGMTLYSVLKEWGDPRKWAVYTHTSPLPNAGQAERHESLLEALPYMRHKSGCHKACTSTLIEHGSIEGPPVPCDHRCSCGLDDMFHRPATEPSLNDHIIARLRQQLRLAVKALARAMAITEAEVEAAPLTRAIEHATEVQTLRDSKAGGEPPTFTRQEER